MNGPHLPIIIIIIIIITIKKKGERERGLPLDSQRPGDAAAQQGQPVGVEQAPTCGTHIDVYMQSTPSICFSIPFQGREPKNEEDPDLRRTTPLKTVGPMKPTVESSWAPRDVCGPHHLPNIGLVRTPMSWVT